MKLEAVSSILHSAGVATLGSDLYIYHMPEGVQSGILLMDDPDTPTEIDEYIPKLKKSNFRAIVRGSSYEEAMNLANVVRCALDVHGFTANNGINFLRLKPTYDPIAYPVGESDIIEVSVNLWAAYIEP